MKHTITGTIKRVLPLKNGGSWQKTEIHVHVQEEGSKYPDVFAIEFWGDTAEEAQGFTVGEIMEFQCFLGGREWQRDAESEWRAFLSLKCKNYKHLSHPATDEQKAARPPAPTNAPPAAGGSEFPWSGE